MQCPNCGDPNYLQGAKCAACAWEPLKDPELLEKNREERLNSEKEEYNTNVVVAIIVFLFFLFIFWFFPSGRRSNDWFDLTFWETVTAAIIGIFAFSVAFKK